MAIRIHSGVEVIQCGRCQRFRRKNKYFPSTWLAGCGRCKDCCREPARIAQAKYRATPKGQAMYKFHIERRRTNPRLRARDRASQQRWAHSIEGHCTALLKKHRARNLEMGAPPPDYTARDLAKQLKALPYCSVTGARLSIGPAGRGLGYMHPWAASIDRIDPTRPYASENIRLTSLIYNLAKHIVDDQGLREAVLHLLGIRPYVLRPGESWANPRSRPRRAKGFLASELADRANSLDVRQDRRPTHPVNAEWVRSRLGDDAVFGARLVVSPTPRHPLQPSVDRIDPSRAHDQENCRILALIVNEALHAFEQGERALRRLFRLILNPLLHASGGAALWPTRPPMARSIEVHARLPGKRSRLVKRDS